MEPLLVQCFWRFAGLLVECFEGRQGLNCYFVILDHHLDSAVFVGVGEISCHTRCILASRW